MLIADTALIDCGQPIARPGALDLLDEAMARDDVFVAVVSQGRNTEVSASSAALGAVLGPDRVAALLLDGAITGGGRAHSDAVSAAFEHGRDFFYNLHLPHHVRLVKVHEHRTAVH